MPSTRPKPSSTPFHESIRTAIIVGVIIGVLGLLILTYHLYQQRLRQTVKTGTWFGSIPDTCLLQREKKERDDFEKGLEKGVIPKPLPVYRAKPMKELGDDVKE
jgi:H+/gluconate symporter-like permease